MVRHTLPRLAACLALLGLAACVLNPDRPRATTQVSSFSTEVDFSLYGLGPNDMLRVTVLGHPELSTIREGQRVTLQGEISLPLVGTIPVAGRNPEQVRLSLINDFGVYLRRPELTLSVVEYRSRQFYILGHVTEPGAYALDRPLTMLQGLASGGRAVDGANRTEVFVLRASKEGLQVHEFNAETPGGSAFAILQPDDVIFVQPTGSEVFRQEVLPQITGITGIVNSAAYIGLVANAFSE